MGHDALPFATWHNLAKFVIDELAALSLQGIALRNVDDVAQLFLVNAEVIVHLSLVAHSLKSVQVQV